jgi:hypothetical protein
MLVVVSPDTAQHQHTPTVPNPRGFRPGQDRPAEWCTQAIKPCTSNAAARFFLSLYNLSTVILFVPPQIGCIIAGIGDLAFDPWAYAFAFSSVISQALYLLLVEFQVREVVVCVGRGWIWGVQTQINTR